MAKKEYNWPGGAELGEHSRIKHKILKDYFRDYLVTRCSYPVRQFRLAIVDGFAGAGKYKCGSHGSPLIFIQTLKKTISEINIKRTDENLPLIAAECLFIFNDNDKDAINILSEHCSPYLAEIKENEQHLHIRVQYLNKTFQDAFPEILQSLDTGKYGNVLFNLDQCGYSQINLDAISHILSFRRSSEIFLTFAIKSFLAYLSPDLSVNKGILEKIGISGGLEELLAGDLINKNEFLGVAENLVFQRLKQFAKFASPFSINNPDGWRYWLIHFANDQRARQVYNNILHDNATSQAHFGRAGLNMLDYDPSKEGGLYLFDNDGRQEARNQLIDDIPRLIEGYGDAISVRQFYEDAYSETAAHSEDIDAMVLENTDLEVITPEGGVRRTTIKNDDVIKFKNQRSFFSTFGLK